MNLKNYITELPERQILKRICKAQAVLDWIICGQEFETYHKFFKSTSEEYDGQEASIGFDFEEENGLSLQIFFTEKGCIIVPSVSTEAENPDNEAFEKRIPKEYEAYYKKNFAGQDIPFVMYVADNKWHYLENYPLEEEVFNLEHLTQRVDFYKDWACDFFANDTHFLAEKASEKTIAELYEGKVLTEKMVLSLVREVWSWIDLEEALDEMPYRFDF